MKFIKEDLYNLVSDSLYDACWLAHLPINPVVGVRGFIDAVRKFGIKTEVDKEKVEFYLPVISLDNKLIQTQMTFHQILEGWKNSPKGSLHSLVDSICQIHDNVATKVEAQTGKFSEAYRGFSDQRSSFYLTIRDLMEKEIKPYFSKFQEKVLVPSSGKIGPLSEPWIFHLAIKKIDLALFKEARKKRFFKSNYGGPDVESLIEGGIIFNDGYFPSVSTLEDLFWGHYLDFFTKLYDLPLQSNFSDSKERLKYLSTGGFRGLKTLFVKDHPGPIIEGSLALKL